MLFNPVADETMLDNIQVKEVVINLKQPSLNYEWITLSLSDSAATIRNRVSIRPSQSMTLLNRGDNFAMNLQ